MYDGFEFGVTVAVERPSDLKKISHYLREHFISRSPSYAVSRPTTMNRQEETTESLRTTQLAQGRTELPPQKNDALGRYIPTLLPPDCTS